MNMKRHQLTPPVPKGLSLKILRRELGDNALSIDDLFLEKISVEVMMNHIDLQIGINNSAYKQLQDKLNLINETIINHIDTLKDWYASYFALATQCENCAFNNDGESCSFYGKNKAPFPSTKSNNSSCQHKIIKEPNFIPKNN
jgi:hypothetical protein